MAAQKAMYTGTANILSAFDTLSNGASCYSVWMTSPKEILFQYNEDDIEKGRDRLVEALGGAEANNNTDLLIIKFHPKKEKGFITDKSQVIGSIPIRVCELGSVNGAPVERVSNGSYQGGNYAQMLEIAVALKTLPDTLNKSMAPIYERLEALETEREEPAQEQDAIGRVMDFIESPNSVQMVQMVLDRLIPARQPYNMAVGNKPPGSIAPQATAQAPGPGEVDVQVLDAALQRLRYHCQLDTDMTLLADMADNNPGQFKMLWSMLRG